MAIIEAPERRVMDLRGPSGNVYAIMGMAKDIERVIGGNPDTITETLMVTGSYASIVREFCARYSDLIDIILPDGFEL